MRAVPSGASHMARRHPGPGPGGAHIRPGAPASVAKLPGMTRHLSALLPFLLTAALAGGAGAPPVQTGLAVPQGAVEWNEDLPAASPAQARQIAAWVNRATGVTCDPRETQAAGHVAAPLGARENITEFTRVFVEGGRDEAAPFTAQAWFDRDAGRQIGILALTPRAEAAEAGHGVMLLIPDQPRKGRMMILTCFGRGTIKLRPSIEIIKY